MAFLACGGSNSEPTRSSEQMENLLRSSNAQNKVSWQCQILLGNKFSLSLFV